MKTYNNFLPQLQIFLICASFGAYVGDSEEGFVIFFMLWVIVGFIHEVLKWRDQWKDQ